MKIDRIDLMPSDMRSSFSIPKENLIAIGLLVVLLLVILMIVFKIPIYRAHLSEWSRLAAELSSVQSALAPYTNSDQKVDLRSEITQQFGKRKSIWTNLMKEISLLTPKDVWLTNLKGQVEKSDIKLTFQAEAVSQDIISKYMSSLENSYYFRHVKFKISERLDVLPSPFYRFEFESAVALSEISRGEP